jgi:hypothetical protein
MDNIQKTFNIVIAGNDEDGYLLNSEFLMILKY